METKLRIRVKRNEDKITSIPKELIRAAVRAVYKNPDDPKWPKPDFTFDDIILVPSPPAKKIKTRKKHEH